MRQTAIAEIRVASQSFEGRNEVIVASERDLSAFHFRGALVVVVDNRK
jgi:hypothetical protein